MVESFSFAGSSALLLSVAHLYPRFWYLSLLALIPFLWRIVRATLFESVVIGSLLATSYCLVAVPIAAWLDPIDFFLKLCIFNALFALYAVTVNRLARLIGFNAVLTALLWLPIEYALSNYADLGIIFALSESDSTILIRIGSLFGVLMVSFAVVLINALIFVILMRMARVVKSRDSFSTNDDKRRHYSSGANTAGRRWCYLAGPRAPPRSGTINLPDWLIGRYAVAIRAKKR
jgi:hypothetical protein